MELIIKILTEALTITCFVIIMLLLIEYFNIKTRGSWFKRLKTSRGRQVVLGAVLGMLPGCLGGYAVVSLYTHNVVGFGSLLAAFIATLGDETFVMLSVMPGTTLIIMGGLFAGAIIAGLIADRIYRPEVIPQTRHFEIHEHEHCVQVTAEKTSIIANLKNPSFQRGLLIFGLVLFIVSMITGVIGHHHDHMHLHDHAHGESCDHEHGQFQFFMIEEWMQYTFLILAAISLFIILKVSDHFLNEHLWGHIIKKHFLKIFLWIIVSIAAIQGLLHVLHIEHMFNEHLYFWSFALMAIAIGIIPQSGPHIIFISLFTQGVIPLSVLLANAIVHEGHASLPLLAESKKSFIIVKGIKIMIALVVVSLGYFTGF